MQLKNKTLRVIALGAASACPLVLHAAEGSEISFKQARYAESDKRVKVDYTLLELKEEIGADYTASLSLSYDTISGGTPIWVDAVSGASGTASADGRITTVDGKGATHGGRSALSAFSYKNIEVEDTRRAVSTSLTKRTPGRDEITVGLSQSKEEDFSSKEASLSYLYNLDSSRNRSLTVGVSYQANEAYHLMYGTWKDFSVVNAQVGYTHTLSKSTVGQINYFHIRQSGELSNPYQTILRYFAGSNLFWRAVEKRPDEKNASGISAAVVSKVLSNTALHADYRFYRDDWGVRSHTLSVSPHVDVGGGWTVSPMLRYYRQSQADFYKSHDGGGYFNETEYGTADERLGEYHGTTYALGIEKKIGKDLKLNVHAATQKQSNGLKMAWGAVGLVYGF